MARLREVCADAGCADVTTYIASGNVLFTSGESRVVLQQKLEAAIEREFGLKVAVVVISAAALSAVIKRNPFPKAENGSLHVAFRAEPVASDERQRLRALDAPGEVLAVDGRQIYFHLPNGYGRAALPPLALAKLKVPATVRN